MIATRRRARAIARHGSRPFFDWTVDDADRAMGVSQPTDPDPTPIDTPPDPLVPIDVPEPGPVEVPEPTPV